MLPDCCHHELGAPGRADPLGTCPLCRPRSSQTSAPTDAVGGVVAPPAVSAPPPPQGHTTAVRRGLSPLEFAARCVALGVPPPGCPLPHNDQEA